MVRLGIEENSKLKALKEKYIDREIKKKEDK